MMEGRVMHSSPRKRPGGRVPRAQSADLCPPKQGSDFSADSKPSHNGNKREKLSVHSFYKIGRMIGDGNFAIVRECRHRKSSKKYALKVINKSKVKGKEHMIENEILILRRVRHDCIVRLLEEFETPKEIFLVMELVAGGDLFDAIVEVTKFNERDASHMIRDLAMALQYLHTLNIVHRDIKPENLLVVNNPGKPPSLKLADFGLSIEVKSPLFLVCGTPTYVAPEILDESGYGLSVDVWAMGVIAYILLCGFPPFRSNEGIQQELFDKILQGEFEYLMPFWSNVSDLAKDLIEKLLVVDRRKRYTAKDVLTHTWILNSTVEQPEETSNRSKEVEANISARKRLRAIAMAIQTVIALLSLVRRRRDSMVSLPLQDTFHLDNVRTESSISAFSSTSGECSSSSLGASDGQLRLPPSKPSQSGPLGSFSRIPRLQRSTPCSHIAEIRKSMRKDEDCSSSRRLTPSSMKYYASGRSVPVKFTSDSIPSPHHTSSVLSKEDSTCQSLDQYDVIGAAFDKYHHLDHSKDGIRSPKVKLRPTTRRESNRYSVPPGVLEKMDISRKRDIDTNPNDIPRCKSAVPSSPSKAKLKSYGSVQCLASPTRRSRYKESEAPRLRPGAVSRNSESTLSPVHRPKKSPPSSQKHQRRYSMPVLAAPVSSQKGKGRKNIVLTTKTKRVENITIHGGNTVDKKVDTKTQTTLSLEFADRKQKVPETIIESEQDSATQPVAGKSLLNKVKMLAEEIETLATYDDSQSSTDGCVDLTESELEADSLEEGDIDDTLVDDAERNVTPKRGNDDYHLQSHYLSLPSNSSNEQYLSE